MDSESIYGLISILMGYIRPADKEEALFTVIDRLVDEDVDLEAIRQLAEDEEEELMAKCIKKYIKENFGEEEEEEW